MKDEEKASSISPEKKEVDSLLEEITERDSRTINNGWCEGKSVLRPQNSEGHANSGLGKYR